VDAAALSIFTKPDPKDCHTHVKTTGKYRLYTTPGQDKNRNLPHTSHMKSPENNRRSVYQKLCEQRKVIEESVSAAPHDSLIHMPIDEPDYQTPSSDEGKKIID